MNSFFFDGTASRDHNALRRPLREGLSESSVGERAPFKRTRFYEPWNLPSLQQFNEPASIFDDGLFVHEVKWDDKTTGVHTVDKMCDTNFFGYDIGPGLTTGEFLLLYTGPPNFKTSLINSRIIRSSTVLPYRNENRPSRVCKVVPLTKLTEIISDTVKRQREFFDLTHLDLSYESFLDEIGKNFDTGSLTSVLSRLRTPEDFCQYFKPLGFLHSFDGKPVYDGNNYPLVTAVHYGNKYIARFNSGTDGNLAPKGSSLYYAVGLHKMFHSEETWGHNCVFNYPLPRLTYSLHNVPHKLVRELGYVHQSREGHPVPSVMQYVGSFITDFYAHAGTSTRLSPYVQVDMLRNPTLVY